MVTVHSQPQDVNYSKSLPHTYVTAEWTPVDVKLYKDNVLIVDEVFDLPPHPEQLKLDFRLLIDELLSNELPESNELIHVHENIKSNFVINISDGFDAANIAFTVIKGFAYEQPFDTTSFFRDNWLNIFPPRNFCKPYYPIWLTSFPTENVNVKIAALFSDGSTSEINYAQFTAHQIQSVNLLPGTIESILGKEFVYFDVFTSNGNVVKSPKVRFYNQKEINFDEHIFVFANRLGGWDTVVFNGQSQNIDNITPSTALFNELEKEYFTDHTWKVAKNSGHLISLAHQKQAIDFISSSQRFALINGSLQPIILEAVELQRNKGRLVSFDFIFKPVQPRLQYPELHSSSNHLFIT